MDKLQRLQAIEDFKATEITEIVRETEALADALMRSANALKRVAADRLNQHQLASIAWEIGPLVGLLVTGISMKRSAEDLARYLHQVNRKDG